uniref:Uncharacterized protein n=1 Tax=Musca domestica TaxID=7370 RepID=A0A1I8M7E6_MUSDO
MRLPLVASRSTCSSRPYKSSCQVVGCVKENSYFKRAAATATTSQSKANKRIKECKYLQRKDSKKIIPSAMYLKHYWHQLLLLLLALPPNIFGGPVSNPEINSKTVKTNNLQQQQQQHQQHHKPSDAHLNTLKFKPSYKLADVETNFTPIQNGNSIAPEIIGPNFMGSAGGGGPSPVLMQYLPQTINDGGVQYLQLMVPIGPYLGPSSSAAYGPALSAPTHSFDYSSRPTTMLSAMPVNMPPPAPTPLVEVPSQPLPAYGIQSYAAHLQPYKQNYRTNRETKDRQTLSGLSLNMNEYIPVPSTQGQQQPQPNF